MLHDTLVRDDRGDGDRQVEGDRVADGLLGAVLRFGDLGSRELDREHNLREVERRDRGTRNRGTQKVLRLPGELHAARHARKIEQYVEQYRATRGDVDSSDATYPQNIASDEKKPVRAA